jgi:hypothetical protein
LNLPEAKLTIILASSRIQKPSKENIKVNPLRKKPFTDVGSFDF